MTIVKGNIGNALHSVAPDHIVATADEIFDETLGQYQSEINQSAGAFDISEYNKSEDTPATYATLALALAGVPSAQRKGGMTIKYIDSTTSKYVQYRLTATSWSTTTADWQGVDDGPTAGSNNLVKSGGVAPMVRSLLGNNNTINKLSVPLIPSHTYQLNFNKPNWDTSGVTVTGAYLFDVKNVYNSAGTILLAAYIPASGVIPTIDKTYTFTVPNNSDYISIEGRATLGERVYFTLEDITSEQPVRDRMWSRCFTGDDDNWVFDEIIGLKQGRKYRFVFPKQSWDETELTGSARFQVVSVINGIRNQLLSKSLPLDAYYDITIPTSAEYDVNIRTVCKAVKDVVVNYYIYDVTEISDLSGKVASLYENIGDYFDGAANVTGSAWLVRFDTIAGETYTITSSPVNSHQITTYLMTGTTSASRVQSIGTLNVGSSITFTSNQNTSYIGGYTQDASVSVSVIQHDSLNEKFTKIPTQIIEGSFNSAYHTGATNWADKCAEFSELINDSAETDSFLFFTDPHFFTRNNDVWQKRMPEFISEMQKYYNSVPMDFCVSGGDWLTAQDSNEVAQFRLGYADGIMRSMFRNYKPVFGNHDDNYQGASEDGGTAATATPLSTQTMVNLWFRQEGKAYYSFTGKNGKFYVFDTGNDWNPTTMTDYRWEQVDWFANELLQNSDKHIVIIAHIAYNSSSALNADTLSAVSNNIALVAQAYNARTSITLNDNTYDFTGKSGKVEFMLAGHLHLDSVTTKYGIPIICTINTMKVISEPSFDLMYVDYDNRVVNCIRVGSGANRTINLP